MIFICYLEARKVLNGDYFGWLGAGSKASFAEILRLPEPTEKLFKLFRKLQTDFCGSMFDEEELREEAEYLRDTHVDVLRRLFFDQTDLADHQLTLGFDLYDFSVIPVETISAIYEDFIRAEDSSVQRATGTYYTPSRLVDFTLDLALGSDTDLRGKRVLDPACGSGAFLVAVFNRMAESWVRKYPQSRNGTKARELSDILRNQITGVDINLTACRITCFSLYLALLDFLNPRDIRDLPVEGGLPKLLLRQGKTRRVNSPQTVIEGDFLSTDLPVDPRSFDIVVGNPPWSSRRKDSPEHRFFKRWKNRNKTRETPADQIACAFMWHVPKFLKKQGRACLLLPAGVRLNDQTNRFQEHWFSRHSVAKIAHLADLRRFLFDGAINPAVAISFSHRTPSVNADTIEFLTPKSGAAELNGDRLTILPEDRKAIKLRALLDQAKKDSAPLLWFSHSWATPRDQQFLSRLLALPRLHDLAGGPKSRKPWLKSQGFKPAGVGLKSVPTKQAFWSHKDMFLDAKSTFDFVLTRNDCGRIGTEFEELHRCPNKAVFKSPLVVFNQGFSKFAFSPFDVLFRHALQSISGPDSDRNLLMFLVSALASPLGDYYAFHCTTKSSYRERPLLSEVLAFPFPRPEDAPGDDAEGAVEAVAQIMSDLSKHISRRALRDKRAIHEARAATVDYVYAYYDVAANERILINDTLDVLAKSNTPTRGSSIPTIESPTRQHRQQYAKLLRDTLERWGKRSGKKLRVHCAVSPKAGLGVVTLSKNGRTSKPYMEDHASEAMEAVLARLNELLPDYNGSLVYLRNLKVFDGDDLYIVKPLTRRSWLRTAALNDADEIATEILRSQRKAAV